MREAKQAGSWILVHSLINPDHTCSLYLPKEILQTSSFSLLILQAIMIFCGRLSFHAVLLTAYPRSVRLHVWLQGARRSAAPADSVIPRLRAFRHVFGWPRRSRSLWPHRGVEGNNKAAGAEEPCQSAVCAPFQMGTRELFPPLRGYHGIFTQKIATLSTPHPKKRKKTPENIDCLVFISTVTKNIFKTTLRIWIKLWNSGFLTADI